MEAKGSMRAAAVMVVMAGAAVVASRNAEHVSGTDDGRSSPALTADASMRTFELAETGYAVELVASEPEVTAPVAMRFDEDGNLWVVEMPSYMLDVSATGERAEVNRIVVLEDRDRDGRFETKRVFMDGLRVPRGVLPCFQQKGRAALVIEPPEMYFARDTDGDGKADERTPVMGGIAGLDNPEHAPNGLQWGMDNWIEFSQHSVGFKLDKSPAEGGKAVTRPSPGHGQWGISMDDLGRLYYVPNSDALRVDALPKWYASRGPGTRLPALFENAARDQLVWPSHETRGVNRGYQPDILRENGRLRSHTAACGPSINRGPLLGDAWAGDAFVCEPAANLVRRLKLKDEGGIPVAKNAYERTELLRSTDERFRPVNSCVGPDGAVYLADMYRGVIQHKTYLTPYLKGQIAERGLEAPTAMGRIYRIVPEGGPAKALPRMGGMTDEQLVAALRDTDGWVRDTAQRLLIERRATGQAAALGAMVRDAGMWQTKVQALWTLWGVGALDDATLAAAAAAPEAEVREHAARVAGEQGSWRPTAEGLLTDRSMRVRWQAALSLGGKGGFDRVSGPALVRACLANGDDRVLRGCVVNALHGVEIDALRAVSGVKQGNRGALASELAEAVIRGSRDEERSKLLDLATDASVDGVVRRPVVDRVTDAIGLRRARPSTMRIAREPGAWAEAKNALDQGQGERMAATVKWMDWPGRPPVDRGVKAPELTDDQKDAFERGRTIFAVTCAACHGAEGKGVIGQTPPLAGSPRATGPVSRAARIIMHGMDGGFERDGAFYNGQMPAATTLGDREIADVLTFVRRSWGNTAAAVSAADVLAIRLKTAGRTKAWLVGEVDSIPEEER